MIHFDHDFYEKQAIKDLKEKNPILNIKAETLNWLARIWNIWELISLSEWKEIEGVNSEKLFNKETIEIANFIIEGIEEILWENPLEIRNVKIETIVWKIWNKLKNNWTLSGFTVWTHTLSISSKISNIHLRYQRYQRYKKITNNTKDSLTGLIKKESLNLEIENALKNKEKNGGNFWLAVIDIDFFKKLNDNYWHLVWDIALKEIASIFKHIIRDEDIIWRWGWEEFALLLYWWNPKVYYSIMERIRKNIEENLKNNVNKNNWKNITENITVSIWVTEMVHWDSKDSLFERADALMYKAKDSGKNCTVR